MLDTEDSKAGWIVWMSWKCIDWVIKFNIRPNQLLLYFSDKTKQGKLDK